MIRKHVANAVTASRIGLGIFGALMVLDDPRVSLWCFVVALITDLLDGPLARKLQATSPVGALLDPIADWILGATSFVALLVVGWLPWWSWVVIGVPTVVFTIARLQPRLRRLSAVKWAGAVFFTAVYACLGLGYLAVAYGWHGYYWLLLLGVLLAVSATRLPLLVVCVVPRSLPERLP